MSRAVASTTTHRRAKNSRLDAVRSSMKSSRGSDLSRGSPGGFGGIRTPTDSPEGGFIRYDRLGFLFLSRAMAIADYGKARGIQAVAWIELPM